MQEAPDLRELMLNIYAAVSRGDGAFVAGQLSRQPGLLFIGTDPDEWFEDAGQIRTMLEAQAGAGVTVVPGVVRAYREGAVGWVANQGVFRLPDGAEVPFRLTAVFREEDGGWKLVQEHASVAVANAEAIGQELVV